MAVLLVVFYHLGWFGLAGGYLGVDVFFVVSGYVISRLIDTSLSTHSFNVGEFYLRRAWRLLPALFATLVLSAVAAQALLTEIDLQAFAAQALGAVFMVANIVLWQQGGYFDALAATKPLLHLWSVSIEQQFYLLFPWWLLAVSGTRRSRSLLAIGGASLALCLVLAQRTPQAAFYLMVPRIWEFCVGAWVAGRAASGVAPRPLGPWRSTLALAGLLLPAFFPFGAVHPGIDAIAVCAATAVLLHRPSALLARGWHVRVLVAFGAISYSLYLVHWPVLAFYRHYTLEEALPSAATTWLFTLSVVLAVLLYALIERPLRRTPHAAWQKLGALGATALLLALWCGAVRAQAAVEIADWSEERRPNHGLSIECEYEGAFEPRPKCKTSAQPNLLVWGDSVAMQYVAGLVDGLPRHLGLVQATMSTCGPILDVSPVYSGRLGESWARKCLAFNDSVLNWALAQPELTHVILAARFFHYVEPGQNLLTRLGRRPQAVAIVKPMLVETVRRLQLAGKKVVIIAPPPDEGFDVGACTERLLRGKPIGRRKTCDIDRETYRTLNRDVIALLDSLPATVLWPSRLLCDDQRCVVMLDSQPIYRDAAHFSFRGSVLFARRFRLVQKVLE